MVLLGPVSSGTPHIGRLKSLPHPEPWTWSPTALDSISHCVYSPGKPRLRVSMMRSLQKGKGLGMALPLLPMRQPPHSTKVAAAAAIKVTAKRNRSIGPQQKPAVLERRAASA